MGQSGMYLCEILEIMHQPGFEPRTLGYENGDLPLDYRVLNQCGKNVARYGSEIYPATFFRISDSGRKIYPATSFFAPEGRRLL